MNEILNYISLCSDAHSVDMGVIPKRKIQLNLKSLEAAVQASESYSTIVASSSLLRIKHGEGVEITIRRDGRMVVRKAKDEAQVRRLATELLTLSGI
jgi:hypothetical protein